MVSCLPEIDALRVRLHPCLLALEIRWLLVLLIMDHMGLQQPRIREIPDHGNVANKRMPSYFSDLQVIAIRK